MVRNRGEIDIGVRDIRERDIAERDIVETVATCRFNQQLLIHIHIGEVSVCLIFSQCWHRWGRFLRHQKPKMLQPTERMSLQSW